MMRYPSKIARLSTTLAGAVAAVLTAGILSGPVQALSSEAHIIPPPAQDETASAGTETAILAGGCFWGVQGVYQRVNGVISAVSGYAGGDVSTAEYRRVGQGDTGHAESVEIVYDPSVISYGQLLHIYFSVVHNPTQLNRQGPDVGTQYRSAIFPQNDEQAAIAAAYIAQLDAANIYDDRIVTTIEQGDFFAAEDYHQDYLTLHPTQPYIVYNDLPKIADLQEVFPDFYRDDPVLVMN